MFDKDEPAGPGWGGGPPSGHLETPVAAKVILCGWRNYALERSGRRQQASRQHYVDDFGNGIDASPVSLKLAGERIPADGLCARLTTIMIAEPAVIAVRLCGPFAL